MLEPGNPIAARTLGVIAAMGRDERTALRALAYSEAMSRRDLRTQLLLIEARVQQNDAAGALRHYDRALRTTRSVPILLSTMIAASNNAEIRDQVIRLLKRRPPWRSAFLVQLIDEQTPPDTVLPILRSLDLNPDDPGERQVLAKAVGKLVGQNRVADARTLLPRSPTTVRNGNFEAENMFPPFDWTLTDDANLNGVIEGGPAGRGNVLFLDARNGRAGAITYQLLTLSPGRYQMTLEFGDITGDASTRPRVLVTCGTSDTPALMTWVLPIGATGGRRSVGKPFIVSAACANQTLTVTLPAPLGGNAPRPWIDDIAVDFAG